MQVEKLIKELPGVAADWSGTDLGSTANGSLSNGILSQHAESGTGLRETQSMLLERIASEMNRLKFYIAHAQVLLPSPAWNFLFLCFFYSFPLIICLQVIDICLLEFITW